MWGSPPPGETALVLWRMAASPENGRHPNKCLFKDAETLYVFLCIKCNIGLFCFFNNKLVYLPNFKFLPLGHGVKSV